RSSHQRGCMTNRSIVTVLLASLMLATGVLASAQQATCLAGKTKCMSKKGTGVLRCEQLAETPSTLLRDQCRVPCVRARQSRLRLRATTCRPPPRHHAHRRRPRGCALPSPEFSLDEAERVIAAARALAGARRAALDAHIWRMSRGERARHAAV